LPEKITFVYHWLFLVCSEYVVWEWNKYSTLHLKVDESDFKKTLPDGDDRFDILVISFRDEEILNEKCIFFVYYLRLSNYFNEIISLNWDAVYA